MSVTTPLNDATAPRTLAAAGLPRRVRKALEGALALVSVELDNYLGAMLDEFEQELFRLADRARNPGSESNFVQALRTFRLNRSDLVPQLMLELEASLAALRAPPSAQGQASAATTGNPQVLTLVEDATMDEDGILREIASRQEGRATLAMHLLGQRFGVLAGSPAIDAARLPLGPQSVCRAMRTASHALDIGVESRELLFRLFDRMVMGHYAPVLEKLDAVLDREGVLPGLTYVPMRVRATARQQAHEAAENAAPGQAASRPRARGAGEAGSGGPGEGPAEGRQGGNVRRGGAAADDHGSGPAEPGAPRHQGTAQPRPDLQRPHTGWMAETSSAFEDSDEQADYQALQQLMAGRRALIGKLRPGQPGAGAPPLSTDDVFRALGTLQAAPEASPRNLMDIRQSLLAQARQKRGKGASLSQRDNDTFELLHMLYGQLEGEISRDAPAGALLRRLQLPLLRVALQDPAFFVRAAHPARQLLNTVAEAAAKWLDKDDFDPQLLPPLQQAVSHVIDKYDGDDAVFEDSNRALQAHLQAQVRRAEMLERRHVEAARGKEKLEVAKMRAGKALADMLGDQRIPKFSRALLNQAWADVLTLTLLRQGEDSPEWQGQLDATRRIIHACGHGSEAGDPALAAHIEGALSQVGYHAEEAGIIANRLTSSRSDEDDPASRTELAMKLKARTRLGEDSARERRPDLPPRTPEEQARYEQLRVIPFGTFIEFVTNQQGDVIRRRLSWFSPVTDNALFVNQRGQRVGEHSLDALARMIVAGQAHIVTAERGRLVDRAWQAAMRTLRSFAGRGDAPAITGDGLP
ncbi:DUF1631 family protein [Luteimonas sp. MC1828]|uniref:DUF1631 family protein n=1 Tax=Luteimonas sp. MC1828 TaxID=2799787 RepID=UPI0018F234A0|nr:DUF1631 family protein [Luteimonas sp. MC1828]MBJ7575956.1 DUF1631 domain-containing protein [Luteimonas sp. MC1828]